MDMRKFLLILFLFPLQVLAQSTFNLQGVVSDEEGTGLTDVIIIEQGEVVGFSEENGKYKIKLRSDKDHSLVFSYQTASIELKLPSGQTGTVVRNIQFKTVVELPSAGVQRKKSREKTSVIIMDPKTSLEFPVIQFEDVLTKIGLGVSQAGGELSSAYNVRGGNFDENLVYVNGIEIYRPFLVRSGQQEGLSFINPDMTESVEFSAGGFEAKYGDKLSSVLDVTYLDPEEFGAGVTMSLMGVNAYAHDRSDNKKFRYNIGARYRTNQYLLNSLDIQGSYQPNFTDIQSLFSYQLSKKWNVDWLTSYSRNVFLLKPESRSTSFGTVQNALRLFVGFGGSELNQYSTWVNGLKFEYEMNDSNRIFLTSSVYFSDQIEHFTVEGAYRLDQLENNLGSENFGESKLTLGTGYFINHARNDLNILVHNHQLRGIHYTNIGSLEWGVKYQEEYVQDRLREWNYNDSSGYNVASKRDPEAIMLDDVLKTDIELNGFRTMGFLQWSRVLMPSSDFKVNAGARFHYWSVNGQTVVSPRMQLSFRPHKRFNRVVQNAYVDNPEKADSLKKDDWLFKLAAGLYQQPPFYRELRNLQGVLNTELRAQRALHLVAGADLLFKAWNRPFRFIGEVYYKDLDQLVPYFLDNVRIRYDGVNSSEGYAGGLDLRVNGEFIKGLESWVNLSLLSTREQIKYTNEDGIETMTEKIRRPTDQRFNASILFRDELPMDPTFKMHLSLVFGSGLPYYFNGPYRYVERFDIPPYRRVDIGFSKELLDQEKESEQRSVKQLSSLWLSVEVFNLLQVNNTISYIWVEDLNDNLYGVPNYLTGRRLNLKLIARL